MRILGTMPHGRKGTLSSEESMPRTFVLLWFIALPAIAAAQEEFSADRLLLKGRYDEAASRFADDAERNPAAAMGWARCLVATGKRDEAQAALAAAAQRFEKSAAVRGELAVLAFERGDYEAAQKHADAALALDPDCISARWATAELLRSSGKLDDAQGAYSWFITYHNRAPRIDDPWDYVYIGRAVAQHARWTRNSNQFRRLVSDFYPALLAREPSFWPARLESALLFAEKFNEPDAAAELAAALAINPHAAELHAAKASLALDRFDLAAAKASIERALEIDSELVWAHRLRADWLLADLRPDEALVELENARKRNPRDEQTLGRILAAYLVLDGRASPTQRRTGFPARLEDGPGGPPHNQDGPGGPSYPKRAQQLVDEVASRNPRCGEFFLAAAEAADRMRRFPLAAELYRTASERMPQLISVRGQLGLVLMRLGEENEAAKLLAESFAIDPFNVRVKNMLEVLDVLEGYAVLETDHFVLKFDRGQDELLARYAARYLEEVIYPRLTKKLGYEPEGKTLIEIFSRHGNTSGHSWFSARMVGLPFIGTVGACAGKVVALASPGELPQKYNWAQVLAHEFVHVLNLQQTDFAVPHWLTEGLAVHLENQSRPRKWLELLAGRQQDDALFDLETLTLGFIRPASTEDWTVAYCQAELYVEYLLATYGDDAIARLLRAYADRCSTPAALKRCFGVELADFETGYQAFVKQTIADAGPLAGKASPTLAQLQRRAETHPDNADAAAALALAWLERDDKPAARRWAVAAKRIEPEHVGAAYVLARLQLSIGDADAAVELLDQSLDKNSPHEEGLALLAALRLKNGETEAAEKLYALGDQHFPHDSRWLKGLARIALAKNDRQQLAPLLSRWSKLEPDNASIHKKLAQLALDERDFAAAFHSATKALHRDVQDADTHAMLAAALAGQNKDDKLAAAADHYEVAIRLDGSQPDLYAGLAAVQIRQGRLEDARLVVGRLREMDADHPQLSDLETRLAR